MAGKLFVGTWNFEKAENMEEFMKAIGACAIMAKFGCCSTKPTIIISVSGDTWTLKSESTFKSSSIAFKLGQEFDECTPDDRKMKTTITLDGDKMVQEQKGDIPSTIIREVVGGDKLIVTCKAKTAVAVLHYVRG